MIKKEKFRKRNKQHEFFRSSLGTSVYKRGSTEDQQNIKIENEIPDTS